jgi:hypothetical protein
VTTFNHTLPEGWTISSRLMACLTLEDGSTVEVDQGSYVITNAAGEIIGQGDDFSPSPMSEGWGDVLETFISFLTYYAEGCDHGDECPWPDGFHEWCAAHRYELEDAAPEVTA